MEKLKPFTTETERWLLGLQPLTTTAYPLRVQRHRERQVQNFEREFAALLRYKTSRIKAALTKLKGWVFSVSLMKLLAIRLRLATTPAKSLVMCLCGGFWVLP